ncbi:ArsA family ATPase [Micrococcus lylae]|uniref:ArsA family ATPase n=1 Tax=Micrococcus lylae TaxID=1273 RepID=UPI0021A572AD|nr:ArsA family ATPase [Micrococcus lylae]MCT2007490.1 ArsA family ATPase [Micrococcus lylae]MCT2070478.1 ArsA family ATPase [Micrococcus lylae]
MGTTTTDTHLSAHLASREVVFFGGKGGVGKTTVASAAAAALAVAGRRVLVVSTDPAHNLGHLWDTQVGDSETELLATEGGGAVVGLEVDPDVVAARHLDAVKDTVRGLMPEHLHREVDRYFRLAAASPGTHEAALLERISRIALEARERFDVVVFDTAPTGHTARLLELPTLMGAWADGLLARRDRTERFADAMRGLDGRRGLEGPRTAQERRDLRIREVLTERRRIFADMEALLTDGRRCAFVPVLTAERMPVLETVQLCRRLAEDRIAVAALVVNRRSPEDVGEVLAARARAEDGHVADLVRQVPHVPLVQVPWVDGEPTGPAAVQAIGRLLG